MGKKVLRKIIGRFMKSKTVSFLAFFTIFLAVAEATDDEDKVFSASAEDESVSSNRGADTARKSSSIRPIVLSGMVGVGSDYIYRGQTQTRRGPAGHGELTLGQRKHDGPYVGTWFSNVSRTRAPNGAGLELDLFAGYDYKRNQDLSLKLELRNTRYPMAHASLPTKDKFDYVEIIPGFSYKFFTVYVAYCLTNYMGINQNIASTYPVYVKQNGHSKGSCYAEAGVNVPIYFISENLKFRVTGGYQYIRNYTALNYSVYTTGIKYKLPESWSGLSLFVNASATTANKKYYRVVDSDGQFTNTIAPRVWAGVSKRF